MQKNLDFLIRKYDVKSSAKLLDGLTVEIDAKKLPILPWRNERRFVELKKLVSEGTIHGVSVMRTLRILPKGADVWRELYREFDLSQHILSTTMTEVFAVGDDTAVNVIAKTATGALCTLEIAATLPPNAEVVDKHEIIASSGVACDRVADTQVPQNSIYVYGKNTTAFTDVDAELFGLSIDECAIVRSAFALAKQKEDLTPEVEVLEKLVRAAKKSSETCQNIFVEEVQ